MATQPCVVDTSVWIEWLTGSALGKKLGKSIPARELCIVPTIVQLELSKWLLREMDEARADQVIAYTMKCRVEPLDTATALLAADLHRQHKLLLLLLAANHGLRFFLLGNDSRLFLLSHRNRSFFF